MNPKTLSIFLGTPLYGYENADTVPRLAEAAALMVLPRCGGCPRGGVLWDR